MQRMSVARDRNEHQLSTDENPTWIKTVKQI
jgi:hypothetical protein